jgi:hypothetical protein
MNFNSMEESIIWESNSHSAGQDMQSKDALSCSQEQQIDSKNWEGDDRSLFGISFRVPEVRKEMSVYRELNFSKSSYQRYRYIEVLNLGH